MREVSSSNFGFLIAFVLPGFTALWGGTYISPVLRSWLICADSTGPTVGGFLYVTLGSVAAGLTVSTVRWPIIDTIHGWTGLPRPAWDFSRLQSNVSAYKLLNEIHYKFYLFHGNSLVSLVIVFIARRVHLGFWTAAFGWFDIGVLLLAVIFYVGSRDTLHKFYGRVNDLLGQKSTDTVNITDTAPTTVPIGEPEGISTSA